MGASAESFLIKAATFNEAKKQAEAYQNQQQHENGHGPYTGHLGTVGIGVIRCNKEFSAQSEAEEYIWESHSKWEPPILAKCGDGLWVLAGMCPS